jgi:hypothetical protein
MLKLVEEAFQAGSNVTQRIYEPMKLGFWKRLTS